MSDDVTYGVYPLLPENRMIVGGVKIDEEFGLILMDEYTLSPPKPKTYDVDIPGANGKIDLTDVFGNVVYSNRSDKFTFVTFDVQNVERTKTRITNFLHGQKFDYSYSMDTYDDNGVTKWYKHRGRFEISSYKHEVYNEQTIVTFEINVDAEPYKYRDPVIVNVNATGGVQLELDSGRMPVVPKITHEVPIRVIRNGFDRYYQEPGTIEEPDYLFKNGTNSIYINSYPLHLLTWGYLKNRPAESVLESPGVTWGEFGTKYLYEWYKNGHNPQTTNMLWWDDLKIQNVTWGEFGNKTLGEWYDDGLEHTDDPRIVRIEYERGDL